VLQGGWSFLNNPFTQQSILHPIIFIIFPLFLFKSYALILAFQAIFITVGVFPVYGIAVHVLKRKHIALMIAAAYLIYPYIAGMYWFAFLYQALFPTLFLAGYYLYLKTRYKTAVLLFLLSGLTLFSYMIFSILFALIIIVECLYYRMQTDHYDTVKMRFSLILLIFSASLFLIINYSNIHAGLLGNLTMYVPKHIAPFTNIDYKVNVLLVLFVPLLALPVLSKRFIILFIPYFYVLFYITSTPGITPSFLSYQFAPLVVPFLFLGFIDALHDLVEEESTEVLKGRMEKLKSELADPKFKFTALMLVLVILFATVYQPVGPFNQYSDANFELAQNTAANYTAFNTLQKIISLIPNNDPYVLTQNNLPEIYPRPLAYGAPMVTGITNFTSNLSAKMYMNSSGKLIAPKIDYILSDLNSPWYLYGTTNMYDFDSLLYSSGAYGIVAEASGFVLLEKAYKGNIKYYEPEHFSFAPSSLLLGPNSTVHKNIIMANNTNSTTLWSTHLFNLAPGKYNITFSIKTNNTTLKNDLKLNLSAFAVPVLTQYYLSGLALKSDNAWTNVSFPLYIYSFFENITLSCYSMHWNGSLYFKNIAISQSSAQPFAQYVAPYENISANIADPCQFNLTKK